MRIAYLISSDIARHRGSTLKVKNQVEVWRSKGHVVEVFARVPDMADPLLEANRFQKPRSLFRAIFMIDKDFIQAVKEFNPDLLYIRQSFPNRSYFSLQSKYANCIEIVSDDVEEYKYLLRLHKDKVYLLKFVLNLFLRIQFLTLADGLVCGTYEQAKKKRFRRYVSRIAVVPNSTTLGAAEKDIIKKSNQEDDNICKIFFIGSPGFSWHGTDKIEALAAILGENYQFHIIGLDGENLRNVFYHGYMNESTYDTILAECHICLSTFALHRKHQDECTTIKFVEYVKKGFPVIVPYLETAVMQNEKPNWVLEIPNRDDVLADVKIIGKIKKFCNQNKKFIVDVEMSKQYISSEHIEHKRLEYMQSLISKRGVV